MHDTTKKLVLDTDIALSLGWTINPKQPGIYPYWKDPKGVDRYASELPKYSESRDACAEFLAEIAKDDKKRGLFEMYLMAMTSPPSCWDEEPTRFEHVDHCRDNSGYIGWFEYESGKAFRMLLATPEQLCESYLRTIGKL